MPTAAFKKVNEERERKGLPTFANPRNFTAGTVRQLDANITAERRMDFFPTSCCKTAARILIVIRRRSTALDAAGFKVNRTASSCTRWTKSGPSSRSGKAKRDSLPYEIDGIVVKVDRTALAG